MGWTVASRRSCTLDARLCILPIIAETWLDYSRYLCGITRKGPGIGLGSDWRRASPLRSRAEVARFCMRLIRPSSGRASVAMATALTLSTLVGVRALLPFLAADHPELRPVGRSPSNRWTANLVGYCARKGQERQRRQSSLCEVLATRHRLP